MRAALLLSSILFGVCACEAPKAHSAPKTSQAGAPKVTDWSTVLRHNVIAAGSTFDGAAVTDVRETAACAGIIVTAKGSTTIRWHDLGNLAPTRQRGRINFDIPAGGRTHVLSARDGPVGTRIDMGLGLLDDQCGGA